MTTTTTTWDPNAASAISLSNNNLTATVILPPTTPTVGTSVRSTASRTTGKAYVEFTMGQVSSNGGTHIGIASSFWDYTNSETLGLDSNSFEYESDGYIFVATANMGSAASFAAGDIVQLCVDFGAQLFWVTNNGGYWNGNMNANPANGTGGISFSNIAGAFFYAGYCSANSQDSVTANFGATAFTYNPPNGFTAWDLHTTQTTWDPNAEDGMTLSNSNLTASVTATGTGGMSVRSLTSWNTARAYVEFTMGQVAANGVSRIGIANFWWNYTQSEALGRDANSFAYDSDGYIFVANENVGSAAGFAAGDVVQLCVDFGAQLFWVTNNGGYWNGNINASPANGTGGISFSTIPGGPWFVGYCSANAGDQATVNFGASAFNYTPPTGFSAWGGGFGGGVIRPAALANYPSWKEYRNWQFGSNTGNNIQSLSELANDGWVHSEPPYYNNADEVELFNTDMTDTNENVVFSTNHCDIVAIWTGKTIGDGPPSGNVSSMQVMLPLDTAVPPLTSIAYVEGWFKCPNVPGAWPTWWSIGHRIGGSASETTWGPEIDFMEIVTDPSYSSHSQVSNFFAGTLHAASSSGNELPNQCFLESQSKYNIPLGHVDYNTSEVTYRPPSFKSEIPQYKLGTFQVKGFINATTAYHRWGCLIEPNHTISIWIDGTKIGHYDATQYCSDGGTPVALNLMIDLALSQTAGMISTSNFYKKNYNGPKNLFRLSMKGVQIWGPPS